MGKKLWVVGKVNRENYKEWEFQGVFDDEQKAASICRDMTWFVAPAQLNECVTTERVSWPGAYYSKG